MRFVQRQAVRFAAACLGGFLGCLARGDDVPFGSLLWLQGIDGNPPLPGFQVDGTLRLEAIDEPTDIALNLSAGRLTNSLTGVIDVRAGPGGARYITGPVLNLGEMDINAINLSWYGNGQCENHGTIKITGTVGFGFYGGSTVLDLEAGTIIKGDSRTGYVWVQNGQFVFNGGSVDFPVYVALASARLGDGATNPITLNFVGPGCTCDGALTANRTLHLMADGRFAPLTLALAHAPRLDGAMQIDTQPSGSPIALTLAPGGLLISPQGSLTTGAGGLGVAVTGNLTNSGTIRQAGPLQLSGSAPVVNTGTWTIASGAPLAVSTPLIQTAGAFILAGGQVTAHSGITLSGGVFSGDGILFASLSNSIAVTLTRNRPLTVSGDWAQAATASLEIRVADADPSSEAAALQVNGQLSLDGPLRVTTNGPITWTPGQSVSLASVTNLSMLTGWFSDVQLPVLPAGMHWTMPASTNLFRFVTTTNEPALELLGQGGITNRYSLAVFGPLGTDLVVEQSTDLHAWQPVTNEARFEGLARFSLPPATEPQLWYRARFTLAVEN
ncbi:MAG TPA: hypothetical protein VMB21_14950 [Candidatus Limnocylindria bacterium]|jgi:hypothetical protein|nr:hypothetical protein [Candidatus Limnocylindria bacterium]